nr:hypothetical protein CFP56_50349 [Quercus suber]
MDAVDQDHGRWSAVEAGREERTALAPYCTAFNSALVLRPFAEHVTTVHGRPDAMGEALQSDVADSVVEVLG